MPGWPDLIPSFPWIALGWRVRGSADNLKKPTSQRCIAANNMACTWNSSEALRRASTSTLSEARTVAKRMAKEARHA